MHIKMLLLSFFLTRILYMPKNVYKYDFNDSNDALDL